MKYDILVIGAGPAGLCFARDMAKTGLCIGVIEKQPESVLTDPPYDGREIALTHLSRKIMQELGIWDLIPDEHISGIKAAKVLNGRSPYALSFDHHEANEDALGFMISNHRIRKAAYESLKNFKNVHLLTKSEVLKVETDNEKGQIILEDGKCLESRLVIAADSRFSASRRMMGVPVSMLDFGRTCIVCTMHVESPHHYTAYECFHFDRTLAVLPLNNSQASIVITLGSEESAKVIGMSKHAFSADIERRTDNRFGKMNLTSKLFPYPLVATFAKRFYAERFALVGDAAVGMHPVTAHGFNLGLRGAHTLASEIRSALSSGCDFSSQKTLESYNRKHRRVSTPLYHGTNGIVRLYTRNSPVAKLARRALLRLGNNIKPAKRLILNQLTETKAA